MRFRVELLIFSRRLCAMQSRGSGSKMRFSGLTGKILRTHRPWMQATSKSQERRAVVCQCARPASELSIGRCEQPKISEKAVYIENCVFGVYGVLRTLQTDLTADSLRLMNFCISVHLPLSLAGNVPAAAGCGS